MQVSVVSSARCTMYDHQQITSLGTKTEAAAKQGMSGFSVSEPRQHAVVVGERAVDYTWEVCVLRDKDAVVMDVLGITPELLPPVIGKRVCS